MDTLTIIPTEATQQVGGFRIELDETALRRMRHLKEPEELVDAQIKTYQEKYRHAVDPDLPDHWVIGEVETLRDDGRGVFIVRAEFRVDVPHPDNLVWIAPHGETPRLVGVPGDVEIVYPGDRNIIMRMAGYNTVDGRQVYTT